MGRSADECRKRWKGLRDTLAKELKKTKDKKKSGDVGPEFVSTWVYFQRMLFIKDCIKPRQ